MKLALNSAGVAPSRARKLETGHCFGDNGAATASHAGSGVGQEGSAESPRTPGRELVSPLAAPETGPRNEDEEADRS